jgi:hypothetical protein
VYIESTQDGSGTNPGVEKQATDLHWLEVAFPGVHRPDDKPTYGELMLAVQPVARLAAVNASHLQPDDYGCVGARQNNLCPPPRPHMRMC